MIIPWGVVASLARFGFGPVVLVHTQKIEAQSEKPTWTKALEFTQFACPCGTDPRLLSGEQRTSHFKLVTSVEDPKRSSATAKHIALSSTTMGVGWPLCCVTSVTRPTAEWANTTLSYPLTTN
jgi:hypothetical protein